MRGMRRSSALTQRGAAAITAGADKRRPDGGMADLGLRKRIQNRVEYGGFRAVAALLRLLPVETAARLSGRGWRLIAPRLRRHARALEHLRLAFPEKTEGEREKIALAMWDNLGRTFAEAFHLDAFAQPGRIRVENADALAAFVATGGVICAPHLGNWELNVIEAERLGAQAAGAYQKIKNPLVNAYILSLRQPLYPGGLVEKSPAAPRQLLRHARAGGTVVVLADLRDARGIPAPFFARPAPSTPFPAMLARRLSKPLAVSCLMREGEARFVMKFQEIPVPVTADSDADIAAATELIQAALERFVRERPEQWMWAHRRWG